MFQNTLFYKKKLHPRKYKRSGNKTAQISIKVHLCTLTNIEIYKNTKSKVYLVSSILKKMYLLRNEVSVQGYFISNASSSLQISCLYICIIGVIMSLIILISGCISVLRYFYHYTILYSKTNLKKM